MQTPVKSHIPNRFASKHGISDCRLNVFRIHLKIDYLISVFKTPIQSMFFSIKIPYMLHPANAYVEDILLLFKKTIHIFQHGLRIVIVRIQKSRILPFNSFHSSVSCIGDPAVFLVDVYDIFRKTLKIFFAHFAGIIFASIVYQNQLNVLFESDRLVYDGFDALFQKCLRIIYRYDN